MPPRKPSSINSPKDDSQNDRIQHVAITSETRRRYLNYAMSVITSRALPDVRDGLKPVQRRILYVMYEELRLFADAKHRKCAKICGDTTGNYHPHGGAAVYEALARMAQDFTLRYPLIDGQGNFGSIMGLPPAADRYTEARLRALSEELMSELRFQTVDKRPNYEGTREEPVVLPARFPQLLVNGTTGIAVGMATNMPPHNLGEVIAACTHLIENPNAETKDLVKFIKGPDFPMGGRLITDRKELRTIYEEGRGAMKVRGEWKLDKESKKSVETRLIVTSIPHNVETGPLMAEIGAVINSRKLPQLVNCADETDEKYGLRIVLEIKAPEDADAVMAYLYKHTALEQNFSYNSTCLIPDTHGALTPARVSLRDLLAHFLTFRLATVKRRLSFQLKQLESRIHILRGFSVIFHDLDKALKIIRNSSGKRDAADRLMKAFPIDEDQTMAILELQLYRISTLEITSIEEELQQKESEAEKLRKLLGSEKKLWNLVKSELEEVGAKFGDKRKTSLGSTDEVVEFDASAYIVKENTNVVVSKDGWLKRVGRLQSVETTRVREGDRVLAVLPGSTLDVAIFFASDGVCYSLPIEQVLVSSGYGEPLSKHFRMADGVSIIAAETSDPRFVPASEDGDEGEYGPPYVMVATSLGNVMQIPLSPFRSASNKAGRKYCRLATGDRVVSVQLVREQASVYLISRQAKLIHFAMEDVAILSGAGKGVRGLKLDAGDEVVGMTLVSRASDVLRVKLTNDKELVCGQQKYAITSRGGKGVKISQRNQVAEVVGPEIELIDWSQMDVT